MNLIIEDLGKGSSVLPTVHIGIVYLPSYCSVQSYLRRSLHLLNKAGSLQEAGIPYSPGLGRRWLYLLTIGPPAALVGNTDWLIYAQSRVSTCSLDNQHMHSI